MPQLGQEESDMAPSSTLKFCKAPGAISLISLGEEDTFLYYLTD
jgi:hypothetical protein